MPAASARLGYMLIFVKPGIVFISLIIILFVSFSKKKSTLAKPLQLVAVNANCAIH